MYRTDMNYIIKPRAALNSEFLSPFLANPKENTYLCTRNINCNNEK